MTEMLKTTMKGNGMINCPDSKYVEKYALTLLYIGYIYEFLESCPRRMWAKLDVDYVPENK